MPQPPIRPLNKIAAEILCAWREEYKDKPQPRFMTFAYPYVEAMLSLENPSETYGLESGDMIVAYALSNMIQWRGEKARQIKAELKNHLEIFNASHIR